MLQAAFSWRLLFASIVPLRRLGGSAHSLGTSYTPSAMNERRNAVSANALLRIDERWVETQTQRVAPAVNVRVRNSLKWLATSKVHLEPPIRIGPSPISSHIIPAIKFSEKYDYLRRFL